MNRKGMCVLRGSFPVAAELDSQKQQGQTTLYNGKNIYNHTTTLTLN